MNHKLAIYSHNIAQRVLAPSHMRRTLIASMLVLLSGCDGTPGPSKSWEVAEKGLYSAALSNDGQVSVIGSINHGGSFWHNQKFERRYDWNHSKGEYSNIIASGFSPEADYALTADHQTMVLWDTASGSAITFWTAPNEVMSVALTPNGEYALLGLEDYSAVLFDVKRGGIKRTFYHTDRVRSVALSTDGKIAITGSEDETAKLWDMNSGEELFSWQHTDEVVTVAISPKGDKAFSVAKYDKAVLWDAQTGKALGELPLKATAIKRGQMFTSAKFSENGNFLLTGNSDRTVQLWNTKTMTEVAHWQVNKRDPWKPTSASILALSFGEKQNEYYAIASNGFVHRFNRP
jgi:WD40 repeat protein